MNLLYKIQDKKILEEVKKFAELKNIKLFVVGGYLRDIFLKREKINPDIDFCIQKDAISFGAKLARKLQAGFVILDKEHGCCRLVKNIEGKTYTLDFADFRGKFLKEDLLFRDFTMNAFCIDLDKITSNSALEFLFDPYQGLKDIKEKIIRVIGKDNFDEDPLRILRAFSMQAIFDFKIEDKTLVLIKKKKALLAKVSFERIRDELFKILESVRAYDIIAKLDDLKILEIIIPEIKMMRGVNQGPYHHLNVLDHSLETIRQIEKLIIDIKDNKEIQDYLQQVISAERKRLGLIKLGAFLHDIGKPKTLRHVDGRMIFHGHESAGAYFTRAIARRLKLSNDEVGMLNKMVFWHLRPGYLADFKTPSERAKFRYFRDAANEAVSVLLISLADQRSTRGKLTTKKSRSQHEKVCAQLLDEYFQEQKKEKFPRFITGDDLIRKFKLKPSPLFGKILSQIQELQAIGKIKSPQEAKQAVLKIIKKGKR